MICTVFRLECLEESMLNVNVGPFTSTILSPVVQDMNDLPHTKDNGFPSPRRDEKLRVRIKSYQVCAVDSLEEIDRWFSTRHNFKGLYRIAKYEVSEEFVLRGEHQLLVDARKVSLIKIVED